MSFRNVVRSLWSSLYALFTAAETLAWGANSGARVAKGTLDWVDEEVSVGSRIARIERKNTIDAALVDAGISMEDFLEYEAQVLEFHNSAPTRT